MHMDTVRDFMRNGGAEHIRRRHDKPPTIANVTARCAAPPTASRVTDADPRHLHTSSQGETICLIFENFARLRFQPAQSPRCYGFFRAPEDQPISIELRRSWMVARPVYTDVTPAIRHHAARDDRARFRQFRELFLNPSPLRFGPFISFGEA